MNPVIDRLLVNYSREMVDEYRVTISESPAVPTNGEMTDLEKLRELKLWYEEGLISEKEYYAEKQKILAH